jgi:hypothetical protein
MRLKLDMRLQKFSPSLFFYCLFFTDLLLEAMKVIKLMPCLALISISRTRGAD